MTMATLLTSFNQPATQYNHPVSQFNQPIFQSLINQPIFFNQPISQFNHPAHFNQPISQFSQPLRSMARHSVQSNTQSAQSINRSLQSTNHFKEIIYYKTFHNLMISVQAVYLLQYHFDESGMYLQYVNAFPNAYYKPFDSH